MYSLTYLLLIVVAAIILIIAATNYLKLHPLLVLLLACFFVGFTTGMGGEKIVKLTASGFGSILSGIGLIVVLGAIIGVFVERSGALNAISTFVLKMIGHSNTITAMTVLGAVISVPVFCDSGFIILSKLSKTLARNGNVSSAPLSLALAAGLYTTHTLVPPTPGPIAVAGNLAIADQLGMIVLTGFLVSIPVLLVSILLAKKLGSNMEIWDDEEEEMGEEVKSDLNVAWASAPILIPIILITLASLVSFFSITGMFGAVLFFLGNPFVALLIGCLLAMAQVAPMVKWEEQQALFKKGIVQAGPIILITGVGGAFGSVLKATALSDLLSSELGGATLTFSTVLVIAFLLAATLKTAQGSSTSALVISSAILAPVVAHLGVSDPFHLSLLVMAFGGGAMTVSHANDSYFWVVTQFSGFSLKEGYRGFTLITLAQGITTLVIVLALYYLSNLF